MLTVLTSEDPQQSATYLEDVAAHQLASSASIVLIAFTVLYQKDQRTVDEKFLTRNIVYSETQIQLNTTLRFKLHKVIITTHIFLHMCISWYIKDIIYDKMHGMERFKIGNAILLTTTCCI